MKIIKAYPPNWPDIARAFPAIKGKPGIIYAHGTRIYNPQGGVIPPWLIAHEEVHGSRQMLFGVDTWWDTYLRYSEFRLEEEVLAHQAEWRAYTGHNRDSYLGLMADRLSGPLYGNLIGKDHAMRLITNDH